MALFERMPRSATVRALGEVRVLTIDKKTFLRQVHEDPSLAFRILQKMSYRIRELDTELFRLITGC
jgi:CRP-like cAMP-binding protein